MDRKCRNKQERKKSLAVSVACMAIYWPTPGFKGRTFKLWVLTRWDFNFCVRSSPLRGHIKTCLDPKYNITLGPTILTKPASRLSADWWSKWLLKTIMNSPFSSFLRLTYHDLHIIGLLVGWCFEPSQPRRIISGLKTNFSPSPSYSAYKSRNHQILFSFFLFFTETTRCQNITYKDYDNTPYNKQLC